MKKFWNKLGIPDKICIVIGSLGIIIVGGSLMMKSFVKNPLVPGSYNEMEEEEMDLSEEY